MHCSFCQDCDSPRLLCTAVPKADQITIEQEQAQLDIALEAREAERHLLSSDATAAVGATAGGAAAARKLAEKRLATFQAPTEPAAIGRIDVEGETFRVGHQHIVDVEKNPLVIDWRTPVGQLFYEASHQSPQGCDLKRTYLFEGGTPVLRDFDEVIFAELAQRVAELDEPGVGLDFGAPGDVLLAELERGRSESMQDIVRTIQAAQFGIVRADFNQLLVVQGGPGTGKSAVALHRVAWLLFNHRETLKPSEVAVIGPTSAFIQYVRNVLQTLESPDIAHLPLGSLGPEVRVERDDSSELARLKGESRMTGLIERGLVDRITPLRDNVELRLAGRRAVVEVEPIEREINRLRSQPYAAGRAAMREFLRAEAGADAGAPEIDTLLDRIWPQLTAPAFLRELFGSRDRLIRAGGDDFTAREVTSLYRQSAERLSAETWSAADVPLLDYAQQRIAGRPDRLYSHIVIDEAQDLSPMQLLSVARRSTNGSMTVLGDIAQSTGPWSRDSWDQVIRLLRRDGVAVQEEELSVGYRVPRQTYEYAARVLTSISSELEPPRVVRDGSEPQISEWENDELVEAAIEALREQLGQGRMVGVVVADDLFEEMRNALSAADIRFSDGSSRLDGGANLLTAAVSKGLEFDAVVLVDPEGIAQQERGLQQLYIALTRTTKHLHVLHGGGFLDAILGEAEDEDESLEEAKLDLSADAREDVDGQTPADVAVDANGSTDDSIEPDKGGVAPMPPAGARPAASLSRAASLLVEAVAADIREGVAADQRAVFVAELAEALGVSVGDGEGTHTA